MELLLRFGEADWERVARSWEAWWAGELNRPLVMLEVPEPGSEAILEAAPDFTANLPLDLPVEEVIERYTARLAATHFLGDAFPKWWPNFGPGIVAGFLGAEVHCAIDTVWFSPEAVGPIEGLELQYEPANPWWRRVQELTQAAVTAWGGAVAVGHSDLGGTLDVLASFRTSQQLLLDLYDAPEDVARLAGQITRCWQRYYDELAAIVQPAGRGTTPWAAIWSAGRCYMLQNDFAYMISPRMFEQFALPGVAECCAALDHAFYHLDGKGQIPHLDMLLSLDRLAGIQWIPGDGAPPAHEWLPLLKRIRDAGKLCQLYVSPEGAATIVRELGGRGFAFYIQSTLRPDEASDFLRAMSREDCGGSWLS